MKKTSKKLVLSKETLRDLTDEELKVAGGVILTPVIHTLPIKDCLADESISYCCTPVI